jgi:uncharacterized protein (TIGR03067 family)
LKRCLFTVLLVLPLLGSDSLKEYNDATRAEELEGTWQIVGAGYGAQQQTFAGPCVVTFRGGKWSYTQPLGFVEGGSYKTNNGRMPAALDEMQTTRLDSQGTRRYIYRIEGDTLRTACKDGLRDLPASFDEKGIWVVTWKRVK